MKNKIVITLETATLEKKSIELIDLYKRNESLLNLDLKYIDLFILGAAAFEIEKVLNSELIIKNVRLPYLSDLSEKDKSELSNLLNQLFLFLHKKDIIFSFEKAEFNILKKNESNKNNSYDSVLLFSGGLDSVIGVNYCKLNFKNTLLVYIRHGNAEQLTPIINRLENSLIKPKELNLIRIVGPKQKSGYFANTRGLLYLLTGSLFACVNNSPLVISECGVTMYQPRFGPLYGITYTTHPVIITMGKEIIKIITKKDVKIQMPFEDNTKTEMIKMYGDSEGIANSFSCLSNLRFATARGNCGECYACLVRRLSILAITDDPTAYFNKNTFINIKNIKEKLYPIVNFCYRVLTDFDGLEYWQKERILKYKKRDLFDRFALDTFIALDKLSNNRELPNWIIQFLKEIDKSILQERLLKLKSFPVSSFYASE